jgi:hypothetical protein
MAIQFLCAACRQPIEVDAEAANQVVTCPYCRKVVTAPPISDPSFQSGAAAARSASEPVGGFSVPQVAAIQPGNRLAWFSLGCATVMVLCLCIFLGMAMNMLKNQGLLNKDTDPAKIREFMMEQQKSPSPAVVRINNLSFMLPFFGIVGVVTGIMGVAGRRHPKWPAIVSLVVCGGFLLLMCIISAMALAAAQGAGT